MLAIGITPTFNRPPSLVANAIATYMAQDYPADRRHLIVLDDAGVFDSQRHETWELVSTSKRFETLGGKFRRLVELASEYADRRGVDHSDVCVFVHEDDDCGFPNLVGSHVRCLESGADASAPSKCLANDAVGRGKWHVTDARGRHHGAWAFRLSAYHACGGYPEITEAFDYAFRSRMEHAGFAFKDTLETGCGPFYLYRFFSIPGVRNASAFPGQWLESQGVPTERYPGPIVPQLDDETAGYYREFGWAV